MKILLKTAMVAAVVLLVSGVAADHCRAGGWQLNGGRRIYRHGVRHTPRIQPSYRFRGGYNGIRFRGSGRYANGQFNGRDQGSGYGFTQRNRYGASRRGFYHQRGFSGGGFSANHRYGVHRGQPNARFGIRTPGGGRAGVKLQLRRPRVKVKIRKPKGWGF